MRYLLITITLLFAMIGTAQAALDPNKDYTPPSKFKCDNGRGGGSASACNTGDASIVKCETTWGFYSKYEVCTFKLEGSTSTYQLGGSFKCPDGWADASAEARAHFGNKYYCERPKQADCEAKKGQSKSLNGVWTSDFSTLDTKAYCDGSCNVTGITGGYRTTTLPSGFRWTTASGTYDGSSCNTPPPTEPTQPPPQEKEPTGPQDCAAGFKMVVIDGKNTCVYGDGGDKKNGFLQRAR